eukprot:m.65039 g.65039  ORF g.65039 m.65039 type:complete len:62 (-) comp49764_c0_seq11:214-399(-)
MAPPRRNHQRCSASAVSSIAVNLLLQEPAQDLETIACDAAVEGSVTGLSPRKLSESQATSG